jgi:hypothetical protein
MLAYLAAAPAITYGRLRPGEVVKLPHTRLSAEARRLDCVNTKKIPHITYILGDLFASIDIGALSHFVEPISCLEARTFGDCPVTLTQVISTRSSVNHVKRPIIPGPTSGLPDKSAHPVAVHQFSILRKLQINAGSRLYMSHYKQAPAGLAATMVMFLSETYRSPFAYAGGVDPVPTCPT